MSDDNEVDAVETMDERPRRGRKPKVAEEDKSSVGIHFGLDMDAAVTIVCKYDRRREMAERLFSEHRDANGLLLRTPACGTSINYQSADRIPLGWNICGCGQHHSINWVEAEG